MTTLGIILSSARPHRVGAQVAEWVRDSVPAGTEVDLIDLAALALPAFDEPDSPKAGRPRTTAHARAWAERIDALDAVVILTPQYNGSYPGALKNAIDYLYSEWADLPTVLVGYGWGAASEVLPVLEILMARVGADLVASIGLGFREDLSVDGEMFVAEEKTALLRERLAAIAAHAPVSVG
ncbi:NADPH-dependent FMN reductase [Brachybacterium saurashtrense]|uniref:NADPH-dependent oxidoreductase n=1 Tax=Brachybacterium saurashtrense TaxID=556288 RepID=A0A345YMR4_9MICO|nr:NAD(P)H-dependent oxidoreductase [Brachybacterium saurashtrense]AXK45216.1 NADPH-dependent oxidoreductase [Brachybacterium saurashtrense]RRR22030.1 NADPH-dependent oxidoreductase [Brachybacterium saurashtrense]